MNKDTRELLEAAAEWLEHLSSPESAKRTVSDGLRALLAKPAAQHQGDPVAIYQAEYRGDGGGGWSDVEYREYKAYLSNPEFNTRIVYTRPAESWGADTPTKDSAGALADALESSDWPGVSIGNKVLIASAIQHLRARQQGPHDVQVACMPVERCYDVRAKMIIAFNEARKAGRDLDNALDAAYKSALRYSPSPMSAARCD
jgi:hypothetical protein